MRARWWLAAGTLIALAGRESASAAGGEAGVFDAGRAPFTLLVREDACPYRVFGVYAMPGEVIPIAVDDPRPGIPYRLDATAGRLSGEAPFWSWTAPHSPGRVRLEVEDATSGASITLNAFVMVPMANVRDGYLNGYRIGAYPSTPLRHLAIYEPPPGLVEVTPEVLDVNVSPHHTLGEFVCKQESEYPKYVALRERLLLKLELVLEGVNAAGIACSGLYVMSGYRTPHYNASIGNVRYSRHVWGGAADVFIDESPRDGMMDDLNGDGHVDFNDAAVLYEIVDGLAGRAWFRPLRGGLARYRKNDAHGPFVHIDVRGTSARWGK